MTAPAWCLGVRRDPHVADDVGTNPLELQVCPACWRRWNDADARPPETSR